MKLNKLLLAFAAFAFLLTTVPETSTAQWSLGASYEIRDEAPENGFGVRLERDLLQKAPLVNLGLRAHFSYFNEENYVSQSGASYGEIENYDYGLAAVGGVSVGLVAPYVGLGLGSNNVDLNDENASLPGEGSENHIYWNGFIGAKVSPIPALKPFVEYRIKSTKEFEDLDNEVETSNGRLIFGVSLAF